MFHLESGFDLAGTVMRGKKLYTDSCKWMCDPTCDLDKATHTLREMDLLINTTLRTDDTSGDAIITLKKWRSTMAVNCSLMENMIELFE
jgi:hypothetical protein